MDIRKYILLILLVFASVTQMQAQADRQFIRNGNKLYRQQNYAKAETEYRKALSKNARNTQAMYNLGCALMMQQKDSAAIVQLQNAGRSEQSPRRKAMAYHNIGVICQGHQMYGEAIEAYKESLRNNPSDNETRYNLALCQRLQKKQKQNGGKNNQKNKNKKDNKNQQNKQKNNNQNKQDQNNQQKQQPKDQMSKDNAQQLLNYAIQQEKATQERLKRNEQQPQRRRLQQNW
uniref:tetratricopeptide repeat protein n=1 Tax=Prevotella sp. TaxID=59823 RepID=UPI004025D061